MIRENVIKYHLSNIYSKTKTYLLDFEFEKY